MKLIKYLHPRSSNYSLDQSWTDYSGIHPIFDRLMEKPQTKSTSPYSFEENEHAYQLEVDVPGYSKKNVVVDIDQSHLTIQLTSPESVGDEAEIETRRFRLPIDVEIKKTSAKVEHGILTIKLQKQITNKPLRIKLS